MVAKPRGGKRMKFLVLCCFCGQDVKLTGRTPPFAVVGVWPNEEEQTWWAHMDCFKSALHPTARTFRDDPTPH